eukprot:jgi/Chrpa1/9064/Chrysochromulina_OHIO_Genome00011919-RA
MYDPLASQSAEEVSELSRLAQQQQWTEEQLAFLNASKACVIGRAKAFPTSNVGDPEAACQWDCWRRATMLEPLAWDVLHNGIAGDFIEAGVYKGGISVHMEALLHAFYTLRGAKTHAPRERVRMPEGGKEYGGFEEKGAGQGDMLRQVRFLQGFFNETLHTMPPGSSFALIRADSDMFVSIYETLDALYPRLSVGGYIVFDDWKFLQSRAAILTYRRNMNITSPMSDGPSVRASAVTITAAFGQIKPSTMRLHVLHMHAVILVCKSVTPDQRIKAHLPMYDPLASQSAEEVSELSRLAQQQQWTEEQLAFLNASKACVIGRAMPFPIRNRGDPEAACTWDCWRRATMLEPLAWDVLHNGIAGDFIEAGVYKGGISVHMEALLHAFYTLRGATAHAPRERVRTPEGGKEHGGFEEKGAGQGDMLRQVRFLPGFFNETLHTMPPGSSFALIRADSDMFVSIYETLYALYPRLSVGGYIVFDDWKFSQSRAAILTYRRNMNITSPMWSSNKRGSPPFHTIDPMAFWRKSALTG